MPAASPTIRYDVFISYARKEAARGAERLDAALRDKGYRVWRDTRGIDPAQDFTAEIEKAIKASRHVVVCVTPDVKRDKSFVRREIAYADALKKPIQVARFSKVLPPISIFTNTWIDFFKGWDKAFTTLCHWLEGGDVGEGSPKPPPPDSKPDPYKAYIEALYLDLVDSISQSVFSEDTLTLRAVESAADVPRRARRLNTKFLASTLRETPEPDPTPEAFDSLSDAYAHARCDGRVLLLGEPGAGKTTTLLALARDAAAARRDDPSEPLPVFARIAGWDSRNQTPLHEWLAGIHAGLNAAALQALIERGEALLLLDGLDELGSRRPNDPNDPSKGDYDPRERFLNVLPKTCRLILSSRVEEYRQIREQAALNCAVRLEKLDDAQIQAYLADVPDLWQVIAADDDLKKALRTPLLLALVRVGFEAAPAEVRALRDLNADDLNDRVWNTFIDKRWAHEQARQPDVPLPYTAEELKHHLAGAAVEAVGSFGRLDTTRVIEGDFDKGHARSVIDLALCLDLLDLAETHSVGSVRNRPLPSWRFLHLKLRDALAFTGCRSVIEQKLSFSYSKAARALGNLSTDRVVWLLVRILIVGDKIGDKNSQRLAFKALIALQAVEPLIDVLKGPDVQGRVHAVAVLARLNDKRAIQALIYALFDSEAHVRQIITEALGRSDDLSAVEPLIIALNDPDSKVRMSAAEALENLRDVRAVEPLIAALQDTDGGVRYSAAEALGNLDDARAVEPLIAALHDPESNVRHSAVGALGALGDARAVDPLIAALRDPEGYVRSSTARALGRLGDARAVVPLIAALQDTDGDVRSSAAEALGMLGDARAVEPLIAALHDLDRYVRRAVGHDMAAAVKVGKAFDIITEALLKLGEPVVKPLIAALQDTGEGVRSNTAQMLGRLGDARAVEPLLAVLHDPEEYVRRSAVNALGELGDARAVEPLSTALQDPEWNVRRSAAEALGRLGDTRAVETLIATLYDPEGSVRCSAAAALGRLGGAVAVEALIAALQDPDKYVRGSAADALGKIGDAGAVEPLIAALQDPNRLVRRLAADSLAKFRDHPAAQQALADFRAGKLPPRTE